MLPTDQAPSHGVAPSPDLTYDDVRQSFVARLQGEQIRLEFLTHALETTGEDAAAAFGELERFAHRLRGAAAVFDVPVLREVSKALEMVSAHAASQRAPNNDPFVQAAVRRLKNELVSLNGSARLSAFPLAAAPVPNNP